MQYNKRDKKYEVEDHPSAKKIPWKARLKSGMRAHVEVLAQTYYFAKNYGATKLQELVNSDIKQTDAYQHIEPAMVEVTEVGTENWR